jgi:hypothetical protein
VEKPLNGSLLNYPTGESPMGIIMYTPDGYMSAQLMRPETGSFCLYKCPLLAESFRISVTAHGCEKVFAEKGLHCEAADSPDCGVSDKAQDDKPAIAMSTSKELPGL